MRRRALHDHCERQVASAWRQKDKLSSQPFLVSHTARRAQPRVPRGDHVEDHDQAHGASRSSKRSQSVFQKK